MAGGAVGSSARKVGGWGGPCCDEEAGMERYSYAGDGRGGYIQETKYRYVGAEGGDFAKMPVKPKPRNWAVCLGLLIACGLIAGLANGALKGGGSPSAGRSQGPAPLAGGGGVPPRFNCASDGLEAGERVEAAADIAFQPTGFVRQGSVGTVVQDAAGPMQGGSAGERIVTVAWDDIPGLSSSKVYRDMLVRAIEVGDQVEAAADAVYQVAQGSQYVPPPLDVADLVRATQDLGAVKKGTYGTIVAIPLSQPGHLVVRFVNQLNTVKVREIHVARAPAVGDRVKAIAPIVPKAGVEAVEAGTPGTVVAVSPADSGLAYRFSVDWVGHARTDAWEAELAPLQGSEGVVVSKGSVGSVARALPLPDSAQGSERRFIVNWASYPGPGAEIARGRLKKLHSWSAEKADFCAQPGLAGGAQAGAAVADAPAADGSYDCAAGEPGAWPVAKASWCCDHVKVACADENSPEGPSRFEPWAVPASFDPAPRPATPAGESIA